MVRDHETTKMSLMPINWQRTKQGWKRKHHLQLVERQVGEQLTGRALA